MPYGVLRRTLKVVEKMSAYGLNQKQPSEGRSNKKISQPAKQQNIIPAKSLAQKCPPSAPKHLGNEYDIQSLTDGARILHVLRPCQLRVPGLSWSELHLNAKEIFNLLKIETI